MLICSRYSTSAPIPFQITDTAQSAGAAEQVPTNAETDNMAFVFQFPPLLPHLVDSRSQSQPGPADTEAANVLRPVADFEPGSFAAQKQAATNKAILKARLSLLTANPPAGIVGKLRVHKSGRITMHWGITEDEDGEGVIEMEVNRGASCDFLQELVVLKEESPYGDDDVDENKGRCGIAYSLGTVKGKYVVSPDFEKLVRARPRKPQATKEEKDQPASPVKQQKDQPANPVKQQEDQPSNPVKQKKGSSGPTAKRRKGKEVERGPRSCR
jgi:DNA-directed RNA polymerase III subunit RPC4